MMKTLTLLGVISIIRYQTFQEVQIQPDTDSIYSTRYISGTQYVT